VADALVLVESRAAALAPFPAGPTSSGPWSAARSAPTTSTQRSASWSRASERARTSPDEITLHKSVGVAVQDDTAAALALRAARASGAGREVEL
jgi:ornithine cyclodeaminase